jgi:hypothetical protein
MMRAGPRRLQCIVRWRSDAACAARRQRAGSRRVATGAPHAGADSLTKLHPAHNLMPVAMWVPAARRLAAHVDGREDLELAAWVRRVARGHWREAPYPRAHVRYIAPPNAQVQLPAPSRRGRPTRLCEGIGPHTT